MNLILFEPSELAAPLLLSDPRARHVLAVLKRRCGDTFDVGIVNGPRGKGTLVSTRDESLALSFTWDAPPAPLAPVTLIIGLPRPQTARDILRDATTLGATGIHFVATERADPNYAISTLWTSGEWRRHCLAGAAQAFDTRLPEVTWTHTLASAIATLSDSAANRFALDNYEASFSLRACSPSADTPAESVHAKVIAIGPERGWGAVDRDVLRATGFKLVHLGTRVLRVETAVVAALAIIRAD
jgi:RsmE family RNA methyltransferase